MDGVGVVASWLTPTVLFCVLNLMIGIIFITSSLRPHKKERNLADDEDAPPPQLVRVPSFVERVKSFNLSRYRSEQPDLGHYAAPAQEQVAHQLEPEFESEESHQATRSKSDTGENATPASKVLKKSTSEKLTAGKREKELDVDQRRPATVREKTAACSEEDDAVDAKADDFINRFRQQLKLQRLDSILRYKEMLNRGTRS